MESGANSTLTEAELATMPKQELETLYTKISAQEPILQAELDAATVAADQSDKAYAIVNQTAQASAREVTMAEAEVQSATTQVDAITTLLTQYESNITRLDAQIAEKDTAIQYTDSVLQSYETELAELNGQLAASDEKFKTEIATYKVFKAQVAAAEQVYATYQRDLQEKTATWTTATQSAQDASDVYTAASSVRTQAEAAYTAAVQDNLALAGEVTTAQITEMNAFKAQTAAEGRAATAKTKMEAVLLQQQFSAALQSQADAQKGVDDATRVLQDAVAAFEAAPTNATLRATKAMAETSLASRIQAKDAADGTVQGLSGQVDTSAEKILAQQLADLDTQIAKEQELETGSRQKATAATSLAKQFATKRDAALEDSQIQAAIVADAETQIQTAETATFARQKEYGVAQARQKTAADALAPLEIAIQAAEETLTAAGEAVEGSQKRVTMATAARRKAVGDVSGALVAVTKSQEILDTVNQDMSTLVQGLQEVTSAVESSQKEKRQAMATATVAQIKGAKATAALDLARFQMLETFTRERRIGIQGAYEAAVEVAVQAATSGAKNVDLSGIDVQSNPQVQAAYRALQIVNEQLDRYDMLQQAQAAVVAFYPKVQQALETLQAATETQLAATAAAAAAPGDFTLQAAVTTAQQDLTAKQKAYEVAVASQQDATEQLQRMSAAVLAGHMALFPNTAEQQQQADQVQAQITAGIALA